MKKTLLLLAAASILAGQTSVHAACAGRVNLSAGKSSLGAAVKKCVDGLMKDLLFDPVGLRARETEVSRKSQRRIQEILMRDIHR